MKSAQANRFSKCACEPLLGSDNGKWIFESIFAALKNKAFSQAA
jgi:hypothetical protein